MQLTRLRDRVARCCGLRDAGVSGTRSLEVVVLRGLAFRVSSLMRTSRHLGFAMLGMPLTTLATAQTATVPGPSWRLSVADYRPYLAETHSVRRALNDFAAAVARRSNGQLEVDVLSGTVSGSPAEQIDALRNARLGAPQIMLVAATGLAELQKEFAWFDQPYVVRDSAQVDAVVEGPRGRALLDSLPAFGLVGLAWMENGFRQLSTTRTELHSLSDLRGMKVRTLPVQTSINTFTAWGAVPVPIAAAEVRQALERGAIEAQEGFVSQLLQGRLFETQKHLWLTQHSYGAQTLVINTSAWRSLNESQQGWLKAAAEEAARVQRLRAREEELQALQSLERAGMQVHHLTPEFTASLAKATLAQ